MSTAESHIRDINGQADLRAVERLQKEVWGLPDLDVVPLTQLVAAKASGGVLIGSFYGGGLAGFAYGFTGLEAGHVTHHSHMLAVSRDRRSLNIGYLLKLAQREKVLALGITSMTWTFDPLQSLNAYFNFKKLGVVSDKYFVDFYGEESASFLHGNGTDRLWVTWQLNSPRVLERIDGIAQVGRPDEIEPLVQFGDDGEPICTDFATALMKENAAIEIPSDINAIERNVPGLAVRWREATRGAFLRLLSLGYVVDGFEKRERNGQLLGRYQLSRPMNAEK